MKRRATVLALVASLSVLSVGCGMASAPAPMEGRAEMSLEAPAAAPAPGDVQFEAVFDVGVEDVGSDRMIVRTADLSIMVEDTEQALEEIEDLAAELEGYVSDLRTWRVNDQMAATVTLRVDAGSLGEARERIKALAAEVTSENVSGQDVTEEYVDLEARLHNLEVAETELLELLSSAQETRRDAESILAIYREVTNIRQQIEQIQGRMQYLENATSLATLSVSLTPEEEEEPVVEPGWDPLSQARGALRTLVNALKFLADLLIWVVFLIVPLAAILALPFFLIWLGWFMWRRRRRRKKES